MRVGMDRAIAVLECPLSDAMKVPVRGADPIREAPLGRVAGRDELFRNQQRTLNRQVGRPHRKTDPHHPRRQGLARVKEPRVADRKSGYMLESTRPVARKDSKRVGTFSLSLRVCHLWSMNSRCHSSRQSTPHSWRPNTVSRSISSARAAGSNNPRSRLRRLVSVSVTNSRTGPPVIHSFNGTGNPILSLRLRIASGILPATASRNTCLVRPPRNLIRGGIEATRSTMRVSSKGTRDSRETAMLTRSSTCSSAGSNVFRSKWVILLKYDFVSGWLNVL